MLKNVFKSFTIQSVAVVFIVVLAQPVLYAGADSPQDLDFQIKPKYTFSNLGGKDPFIPKYKETKSLNITDTVDISTLMIVGITESGGDMAALFKSRLGDSFGFILMGGKFYGSNDTVIPDILGEIKSNTEVVLRQGDKEIIFTLDENNINSSIRPTEVDPEK